MRPPQNGRPGSIGDNHGLTRLTHALEALEAGQRQQETRDTAIQAQLTTQAALLTQAVRWGRYQLYSLVWLGLLTLALSGLAGWQVWHPPEMRSARALGALDTTLGQQWGSLPRAVQEQLSATYRRRGMASPGDRQGARQ
jgi:hypothetical protein